jgi:NADP-reducing hydrogenase subunit HndA
MEDCVKSDSALAGLEAHAGRPGDLIEVLHHVQEGLGYIPIEMQERIAEFLGVPISHVFGVVTFYHFFSMHPQGDHPIKACLGTACYVRGARKRVLGAIKEILGIVPGETTPDRKFSLSMVRCLGACGLAPAVMIDDKVVGRLTAARLRSILREY